jgi:hypothetical protein
MGRSTTDAGRHRGERGGIAASHEGHGGKKSFVGHADHGGHADHAAMFRSRFWMSLVLSAPVTLHGHMVQTRPGFSMPGFPGSRLAPPVLGTFAFHRDGWPFVKGGLEEAQTSSCTPARMAVGRLAERGCLVRSSAGMA